MRRFLVQAVIDALIAVAIIFLLSRIEITQPFPFGQGEAPIVQPVAGNPLVYFLWGGVFVVVNRIVRPALVAIFGRLLFSTLGLFAVVITALALLVTTWITRTDLVILADPNWLWLFLIAALFTVASLVVDVFLGMNRPHVGAPTGRSIWPFLESLPTPRRNVIIENLRLQQVYEALYQTGVDIALEGTPIDGLRRWFERHILGEVRLTEDESAPQRVGALLQQLGPTYVKIGQMMASRSDILPVDWTTEFARLQSDAEPFPWKDAWIVLRSELGQPPEELFATIEEQPFAAASTAQVHRATLPDGTLVAVKIQRPRIVAKTKADLGVMQELAKTAESRFALARQIGIRAIVGEFAKGVLEELDYRNEAYHARRLADGMARFERIHIPHVYEDLSSVARPDDGVRQGHQDLRPGADPRGRSRPGRARRRRSCGRSSSRSSSTGSSMAIRIRATSSSTRRRRTSCSSTSASSASSGRSSGSTCSGSSTPSMRSTSRGSPTA